MSCSTAESLQALDTRPFTKFVWQCPSYLRDITQWLDVLGPGRHYRHCEYNTLHGRACTYTSTSDLFSAFSYIILISDAHEQPVNSAAVCDKTLACPCVHQEGCSSNLRFTKYTIRIGVCCYTFVSLEWTPDREHCPTVYAYLSSSFVWWRLFLVRGHLLLLHFDGHCPYTACLWSQLQEK